MFSFRNTFLSVAALSALATNVLAGQKLQVVWSSTHFSTMSAPGYGGESGHGSGFAITDEEGHELWSSANPGDHSPCNNTGEGKVFSLASSCWHTVRNFKCKSDFGGNPEKCWVLNELGYEIEHGDGETSTNFIGISTGQNGHCGATFELEDFEHCDGEADWTVV